MAAQQQGSAQNKGMSSLIRLLKKNLSDQSISFLRDQRDTFHRLCQYPSAYLHPWRRESIRKINQMEDNYAGKRCFVIGNGPSLKTMDLSPLKNEYTFGMNRVYLAFEEWGFSTSFLVSINDLVIEQCYQDFSALPIPKFFSWHSRRFFQTNHGLDSDSHFLFTTYTGPRFAKNANHRLWEGATVTFVCLQLAYHFGFSEVILIGVDHHFETKGKANQTVVSTGEDPNHFDTKYFGKGFRWQLPDLNTSEIAYRMARDSYAASGRKIFDATVDGSLQVFPKKDFQSLF